MALVLERNAARLGPDACCARSWSKTTERNECVVGDRRPAPDSAPRTGCRPLSVPQPTFVLAKPLRMAVQDNRPI
ncbi:hypothetical protein [Variovorax paradoxus]|uniref:hypothetical protein n=1 Tax=Variovorax paradoxus TaxID=34073 RepID=UPI001933AC22|nr:hypothetical protein INQ48_36865 [Variovorax paradoxus]